MIESKNFNIYRNDFAPYGLTCEKWKAQPIPRIDRHNEIEINFFPNSGATYLFSNKLVELPANRMIVFWGLTPHKTMHFHSDNDYYVCTIPLSTFLTWKVSEKMQRDLLNGEVLIDSNGTMGKQDIFQMCQWMTDLASSSKDENTCSLLEMHARMKRFSLHYQLIEKNNDNSHGTDYTKGTYSENSESIAKLAIYIASNYKEPIKLEDIGRAVGLHPDYANNIFKKTFGCTLHNYLLSERICNAERLLLTTDMPISNIALLCGFSTIARFNATFIKLKNALQEIIADRTLSDYKLMYKLLLPSASIRNTIKKQRYKH